MLLKPYLLYAGEALKRLQQVREFHITACSHKNHSKLISRSFKLSNHYPLGFQDWTDQCQHSDEIELGRGLQVLFEPSLIRTELGLKSSSLPTLDRISLKLSLKRYRHISARQQAPAFVAGIT